MSNILMYHVSIKKKKKKILYVSCTKKYAQKKCA